MRLIWTYNFSRDIEGVARQKHDESHAKLEVERQHLTEQIESMTKDSAVARELTLSWQVEHENLEKLKQKRKLLKKISEALMRLQTQVEERDRFTEAQVQLTRMQEETERLRTDMGEQQVRVTGLIEQHVTLDTNLLELRETLYNRRQKLQRIKDRVTVLWS